MDVFLTLTQSHKATNYFFHMTLPTVEGIRVDHQTLVKTEIKNPKERIFHFQIMNAYTHVHIHILKMKSKQKKILFFKI